MPTYHLQDHLGSVVQNTTGSGSISLSRQYDPTGRTVNGSEESGLAFTGRDWDSESDLYSFRNRIYDPETSRFLSEDPLSIAAGVNLYTYAINNSIGYADPFGLDVAIIYSGPVLSNPLGHIALAVTNKGLYSFGTREPFGSNPEVYVQTQSTLRDVFVYVLKTTPEQDKIIVDTFTNQVAKGYSAYKNNCADVVGAALKASNVISQNAITILPGLMNSYMERRLEEGRVMQFVYVPSRASDGWDIVTEILRQFSRR
jgi:RHS repeat-associated protein